MRPHFLLLWTALGIFCAFANADEEVSEWNASLSNVRYLSETEDTRSVFQLGHMIQCQTGCDPLRYRRYGCFCGFRGAGRPVDFIDNCCLTHDWCYSRLACPPFMLYVIRYAWLCRGRGNAQCTGGNYANAVFNRCAFQLCECDRVFARCISHSSCPQKKAVCWSNPFIAIANILASFT
ncbi:basic phospholipase A2 caudoxin-like [Uloborus diversus]|uniref:basic phospholipase A2 caudoxin-like n=1 Tax=Uloborus diversus TaxID=327109 RepID=UPI002408F85A|nr:basic phospholipase A2 caudoxin-like [Uloborus diversus]